MSLSKIIMTLLLILPGITARSQTAVADSLRQVIASHSKDTIGIKALVQLATEVSRQDISKVKEYAFQGLRIARDLNTNFGVSGNYSHLTTYYSHSGIPDSALYYLDKMKLLAEANPEDKDIMINYHLTAGLFHKNRGEFEKALPHMLSAPQYMVTPKYQLPRAGQLLNIGNTYSHLGQIEKAADYHLQALKEFEALGNKRGQSFCLQSLGNDFYKLDRFSEAEVYFLQSLSLKEELNDKRGMVSSWIGLGSLYTALGRYKPAQDYLLKGLEQSRTLKLTQDEILVLYELGLLHLNMNQVSKARATFEEGLPLARQRGDSLMSAKFATQLASLKQDELNHQTIENILFNKLRIAQEAGDRETEADAYMQLTNLQVKNKQFEKAFEHLTMHHQIRDSLEGEHVVVQLKQLEDQYKQDKNSKEIGLLKKDQQLKQAIIAKQLANQKIITIVFFAFIIIIILLFKYFRTINRTKRILEIERVRNSISRDLHDDIGSALSSIQINSQLAMEDSTRTRLHLQRITESATRMMESMGDIVWSINPENDTLEKMLVRMNEFAAEILEPKNISYSFKVCDELGKIKLSVETRKNLYLIFKESINNAAKFSKGSAVIIAIDLLNNQLHLSVRDNGRGFDSSAVRHGNGLSNMAARAQSLHGRLNHKSSPGEGTEIIAELPIT